MYLRGFRKWRKIAAIDLANHRQRLERVGPKVALDLYLSVHATVCGGECMSNFFKRRLEITSAFSTMFVRMRPYRRLTHGAPEEPTEAQNETESV